MWYKGQKIEGDYDYILKEGDGVNVLDVFANIIKQTEENVTVERFINYGRHQLPTVVIPLCTFEKKYSLIKENEKIKCSTRGYDYER